MSNILLQCNQLIAIKGLEQEWMAWCFDWNPQKDSLGICNEWRFTSMQWIINEYIGFNWVLFKYRNMNPWGALSIEIPRESNEIVAWNRIESALESNWCGITFTNNIESQMKQLLEKWLKIGQNWS